LRPAAFADTMKADMGLLQILGLPPTRAAVGGSAVAKAKTEKLSKASAQWREAHRQADQRIAALKAAISSHYDRGHPELTQVVEQGLGKLDEILDNVDHRLADSLEHASNAPDDRTREAELKNAKAILTEYISYVKGEALIAHMDQNPWKVKVDLKTLLVSGLTSAAKAIG
jgi:hypothetical protein